MPICVYVIKMSKRTKPDVFLSILSCIHSETKWLYIRHNEISSSKQICTGVGILSRRKIRQNKQYKEVYWEFHCFGTYSSSSLLENIKNTKTQGWCLDDAYLHTEGSYRINSILKLLFLTLSLTPVFEPLLSVQQRHNPFGLCMDFTIHRSLLKKNREVDRLKIFLLLGCMFSGVSLLKCDFCWSYWRCALHFLPTCCQEVELS